VNALSLLRSRTVAQLQRAILKVKPAALSGLDPDLLAIQKVSFVNFCQLHALGTPPRKVSIPITNNLKSELIKQNLRSDDELLVNQVLSDAIPDPVPDHLHIVVQIPEGESQPRTLLIHECAYHLTPPLPRFLPLKQPPEFRRSRRRRLDIEEPRTLTKARAERVEPDGRWCASTS
jgi:hypothetical protein